MYNAAIKTIAMAAIVAATSCSGGSKENGAESLVAQADSAVMAKDYTLANELLDTLKSRFPEEIKAQRAGMNIRARANEGLLTLELQTTDSLEVAYTHRRDSLQEYFTFVNKPQLVEGYYVIKEYSNSTLFSRSGIEARVSPDGQFYMISSLAGNPVKHTSITVTVNGQSATSAEIPYDGDRNYRSGGTEMITFVSQECDSIGHLLADNPGKPVKVTFSGNRSTTINLPANDARSIALAYDYARSIFMSRKMSSKKELLDRQLMLARDQAARTAITE